MKHMLAENTDTIDTASMTDIEGILAVQDENLFSSKRGTDQEKIQNGFLTYPVEAKDLAEIIRSPDLHILLVSRHGSQITGYVLGYALGEWKKQKPKWEASVLVDSATQHILATEKIIYLRHIARTGHEPGTGSLLLERICAEAVAQKYSYAVAEILFEPFMNKTSRAFAQKHGLSVCGKVKDGERMWGLFMKKL